jgi:hypothetical protein
MLADNFGETNCRLITVVRAEECCIGKRKTPDILHRDIVSLLSFTAISKYTDPEGASSLEMLRTSRRLLAAQPLDVFHATAE